MLFDSVVIEASCVLAVLLLFRVSHLSVTPSFVSVTKRASAKSNPQPLNKNKKNNTKY